jgi:hypothetical protein
MKLKTLSAACAMALGGMATQAQAITPFEAADVTILLWGATAPDNFIASIAIALFEGSEGNNAGWWRFRDDAGTPAVFTDDGRLFNAYFGQVKNTADIPATLRGRKVMFIKRSKGGSVWGVNPVARALPIATISLVQDPDGPAGAGIGCNLDTSVTPNRYSCTEIGNDPGLGITVTGQEYIEDFGVSDVAPNLFKAPYNVEFGFNQLTASEVSNLSVFAVNTLMMGLGTTKLDGNDAPIIPNTTFISRSMYGSILSGLVQDWTQVDPTLNPPAGTQTLVCRRVPGSGTQTSYNWFFNNFPCQVNSIAGTGNTVPGRMADSAGYNDGDGDGFPDTCYNTATSTEVDCTGSPNAGTTNLPYVVDPSAGFTVIENSTSSNVRDCMAKAARGGAHTFRDERDKAFRIDFGATGGYGAIAVLSVDSLGQENGWSFRNMDGAGDYIGGVVTGTGVAPTQPNLIDGKYDYSVELTMQYRSKRVTYCQSATDANNIFTIAPAANCPGGFIKRDVLPMTDASNALKRAFADEFIKRAGSPAFQRPWTASLFPNFTPNGVDPVAKGTRFGNMCSPLQILF